MAPGGLAKADPFVHPALPLHRLVGAENNEAPKSVQTYVGPRTLQPRYGPAQRLHCY